MFSSQMIASLIVLLISSGALSNGKLECAYKDAPRACRRMNSAYKGNIEVAKQLTNERFNDVKQRLSDTNRVILAAIRTAEREELFMVLYEALNKELNVMFQLKLICSGQHSPTAACKAGFLGLSLSTYNLVYATWEVAEGKRKEAIDDARKSFQKRLRDGGEQNIHPAYGLGSAVLTALERLL